MMILECWTDLFLVLYTNQDFEYCRSIALHGSPIREIFLIDVLNANFSDVVPLHQSTSIVSHHVFLGDIFPKNDPN